MRTFSFIFLPLLFMAAVLMPATVFAEEMQYASIQEVHGENLLIQYRGPGEEEYFSCNIDTAECRPFNADDDTFVPTLDSNVSSYTSYLGTYRISEIPIGNDVYYSLYDVSGDEAVFKTLVPYYEPTQRIRFSKDDEMFFLVTPEGETAIYDIPRGTLSRFSVDPDALHYWNVAPSGTHMSGFTYYEDEDKDGGYHTFWIADTGIAATTVESETPHYAEVSQSGMHGAYLDEKSGSRSLHILNISEGADSSTNITPGEYRVEDFIFVADELFYIANKEGPYDYRLYTYNPAEGSHREITSEVSYWTYLKPLGDNVAFSSPDGKNMHISVYDTQKDEIRTFEPVGDSPAQEGLTREAIELEGGLHAALVHKNDAEVADKAVIWLHGGPHRQTSVGYHSYLSYAVYDELMEQLAASGVPVLKLDYIGSTGYSNEYREGLIGNVGVGDVANVATAREYLEEEFGVNGVHLMGTSYGGYLAIKAMVEDPSEYPGAVSINPVTDWYSQVSKDEGSIFAKHFRGTPNASNINLYMNAAIMPSISNLTDMNTITVINGKQDTSVPTWHSGQFTAIAKTLNKNVELVRFEEEGHILRERETLTTLCEKTAETFDIEIECSVEN